MPEQTTEPKACEFGHYHGGIWIGCPNQATVYGGGPGANDWAGYACGFHAEQVDWFSVWERLDSPGHSIKV